MKSIKYGLATALLAGAFTTPALADVDLFVLVLKHKDVFVLEEVDIDKEIVIAAGVDLDLTSDAEAWALANVTNVGNTVGRDTPDDLGPATDATISRTDLINGSISDNSGGVGVNQDSGDMVNQANLVSYGLTGDADAVTTAEGSVDQFAVGNQVNWGPLDLDVDQTVRITATMNDSVNDNSGIVGVNQNAGNMNNQTNAVAIAIGLDESTADSDGMVALAEADLGQFNAFNRVTEVNSEKRASITGSINGNSGITHVSQAIGSNSNQANIAVVSVTLRGTGTPD